MDRSEISDYLVVPGRDAVDGGVFLKQTDSLGEEAEEVWGHIEVLLKNWREEEGYKLSLQVSIRDPPIAYWALGKSWKVAPRLAL